ncbi:neuronal acetylcholine receptor subunit alpha-3-like [Actinia tenebrosa]|uniref:Neuronal acetylcholine receptor subunit alpha-3-like n=1 Tax=Actinia tenebrosa TaxID=6105 RepID=A0A6P8IA77_ACTTE|nr:neuronal acetylcholine receptor subunit alpha-3-like [Actinia tenebrosa]
MKKVLAFFLVFLLTLISTSTDAVIVSPNNSEGRLMEYIFANYSSDIRPVANNHDPVVVRFGIMLNQIIDVDVVNQIMIVNVWIRMFWKNEMFKWNPEEFGGLKSINVEPSKVWVPDITLYNSASKSGMIDSLYKRITSKIIISSTGDITWLSPAILTTACSVDILNFPFDSQKCLLEFGSWTYNGLKIDIQLHQDKVDLSDYKSNKEWHLEDAPAERIVIKYLCCPEPYPTLKFYLLIKRRAMFYIFNLIIPCGMITLLSFFSFILPPNSGERVSFVITVMLSLSVYMLLVTEKMPQAAETPLASEFFMAMLVLVAVSLVVTCFVIRFHSKKTPFPPILRKIFNEKLAKILFMSAPKKNEVDSQIAKSKKDKPFCLTNGGFLNEEAVLKMTRLVRLHSLHHLEKPENYEENNGSIERNRSNPNERVKTTEEFEKLLHEVRFISKSFREIETEEEKRSEWAFFADVLDRIIFLILLFGSVIVSVGIFSKIPRNFVIE